MRLRTLGGTLWLRLLVLLLAVTMSNAARGGTVVAWGDNTSGETTIPAGLSGVVAIAGGDDFSLALKSDGTVVGWGKNNYGQTNVPASLSSVKAISAGGLFSLALKSDGTVVAWGNDSFNEIEVPAGLTNVVAIAAGGVHSLVLKSDGTVVAWGDDNDGQANVPANLSGVTAIAAGGLFSLALKSDGTVVAWGDNFFNEIEVPAGLTNVVAIAAGEYHSLALKSDGTVVGWGDNSYGETTIPAGLSGVVAIAAGDEFSLALKSDGTVVAWGSSFLNEIEVPAGLSGVVAVSAGSDHSLALVNHAPIANAGGDQVLTVPHDGNPATNTVPVTLDASGSFDPDGDPLTYFWTDGLGDTASGVNPTLNLPAGNYTFTLTVSDGLLSTTSNVHIRVNPERNQAPFANNQDVALNQDMPTSITLTGSDPDGDALTFAVATNPTHGTLSGTAPDLIYTPNAGYVGNDSFTFTVTDPYGAVSQTARVNLTIKDTTPPVITLKGSNPMSVSLGSVFVDPGATATDNVDGLVLVSVSGSVNTAVVGTYTLTYSASDRAGNKATATRTVYVKDTTPPVITLNGSNPMTVTQGSVFTDPGATATDNVDGTDPVTVSGSVNTAMVGTYTLTYSATDQADNTATATRTVYVVAPAPKIMVSVEGIGQIARLVGVLVKVTNTGGSKITNVKITSASLIGVNAFLVVPWDGVSLNPGKSEEVLLSFYPLSKGQMGTLSISGSSSLGAFSLSQSVTIP
jgi:hypothetical protein